MSYEPNNTSPVPSPDSASPQARRRAILAGLGKGSVALAALSPLASEASRSHKLFNSVLGKDCYCSVSGFQSPVTPGTTPATCFTYTPGTFIKKSAFQQAYLAFTNTYAPAAFTSVDTSSTFTSALARALNNYFSLGAFGGISAAQAKAMLSGKTKIWVASRKILLVSDGTMNKFDAYQAKNLPSTGVGVDASVAFNSIFKTSADARSLLEVIYDGVASANPASTKCYYASSFLSLNNSALAPAVPVGLDRAYIVAEYTSDGNAASATNTAAQFFKALASRIGP